MRLLKRPCVILGTFVGFRILQTIIAFQIPKGPPYLPLKLLVESVIISALSVFALRGKKPALWIMGVYMLTQIGALIWGLMMPFHQYVLKTLGLVLGAYFFYGGVVLIQMARKHKTLPDNPPAAPE